MSGANVGSIKAKMELDARGFNTELQKAKQNISASANEAKRVNNDFKQVTRSLMDLGLSGKEIRKVQQEFQEMRPDVLEQQLKHLEVQLRRVGATDDQIGKIKSKLSEVQQETERSESRVEAFHSALAALGSAALLTGLVRTIKSLTAEAQQMQMSYQGLTQLSKSLNVDIEESTGLARELADKGFMTVTEAAEAVKTSLASGLNIEETRKLIYSLADAAAYNRQANYGWGEAVVTTIQGIKQGNSTLTDAVGVTTNLSVMYDKYAKSIGTSAGKLSDVQKIQAAYNGFIQDASIYAGNADKAMEGYTGSQARFNQTMQTARVELGESFMPIMESLMNTIAPIIHDFAEWAGKNHDVIAGLAAAVVTVGGLITAITALIAVVATLRAAFIALNISMGPIGWAIAALSAVTLGATAYKVAADAASESVSKFAENQKELNKALDGSPVSINVEQYKKLNENIKVLNDLLEYRGKLQKEYDTRMDAANNGLGSIENTHALMEVADKIKGVDKELKKMDYSSVKEAESSLRQMQEASKGALGAVVELQRASMSETIAHADNVKQIKVMIDEYDKLSASSNKTEQQKARLEEIVKALKKEYPDLIAQLDDENVWHLKNVDSLKQYVDGEENRVKAASKASIDTLAIVQTEANERIRMAREALKAIEDIESGNKKSNVPVISSPITQMSGTDDLTARIVKSEKEKLQNEINDYVHENNEAKKLIQDLSTGNWDEFRKKTPTATTDDKKKGKTLAELQQEQYQAALKLNEYKKDMGQMSEQQELESLNRLRKKYQENADIRMDLDVKIHKLEELMAQEKKDREEKSASDSFKFSQEWIEQEERRMTLAGKSEAEIAQMKLDAWTRVRNRYEKDSDMYKQADTQVYQARISLIKQTEDAQNKLAKSLETSYSDKLSAALKRAEADLKSTLDGIDKSISDVNNSAEQQVNNLRAAIEGVNEELERELAIYDAQIKALEQAKKVDDRSQAESEHNARLKALEDQKAWLNENGKADPFEIASLDQQLGAEQKSWAEQLKQWQFDDERERLEGLKTAAQERAEVRRDELESQVALVQQAKEMQVAALNEEKTRLQDHWNNEEAGIRAIMENGLIDTIADMAAHDPGFKERGESMIDSLIQGIAAKKESLEAEIASIQALMSSISGVAVGSTIQMPSTINSGSSSSKTSSGLSGASASSAMPGLITNIIQMDSKTIAQATIPAIAGSLQQPVRAK